MMDETVACRAANRAMKDAALLVLPVYWVSIFLCWHFARVLEFFVCSCKDVRLFVQKGRVQKEEKYGGEEKKPEGSCGERMQQGKGDKMGKDSAESGEWRGAVQAGRGETGNQRGGF